MPYNNPPGYQYRPPVAGQGARGGHGGFRGRGGRGRSFANPYRDIFNMQWIQQDTENTRAHTKLIRVRRENNTNRGARGQRCGRGQRLKPIDEFNDIPVTSSTGKQGRAPRSVSREISPESRDSSPERTPYPQSKRPCIRSKSRSRSSSPDEPKRHRDRGKGSTGDSGAVVPTTDGSRAELDRLRAKLLRKRSLRTAAERTIKSGITGRTAGFSSHRPTVIDTQLPAPNKRDLPGDEQVNAIGNLLSAMGRTEGDAVMHGPDGPSGPKPIPRKPEQTVKEAQRVEPDEQDGELDAEGEDEEISIDGGDGKVKGGVGLTTKDSGLKEKAKAA
ncbi:hypothetical protein BN14_08327 [Rhizoctonia solani AG-1 IB]|uniref:Uncharacterized protein n=1 Tax=Thanatephorus cucumeris (strain AG1-IB / isolate 7/3/14) TaxID=1108050 RepID=M5C2N8_THACB|nr:hypothetical protein BN14_08327 [Rhizoctonia solani AG-1 IB]